MSEVDKLKRACPYCGESDSLYSMPQSVTIPVGGGRILNDWAVGCKRCSFSIKRMTHRKDNAIETWNTRPIEDQLKAENERLRAENERLLKTLDKVIQTTDKYEVDKNDSNDYWDWTDNGIDIIVEIEDIAKKVLKEVKE